MIIQVVGTNGAGKSTLVRTVLDEAKRADPDWQALFRGKRLVASEVRFKDGGGLFVPGHYNTPCGGCDSLKTVDQVFDLVRRGAEQSYDVLFEGIIAQDSFERIVALSGEYDLTVIGLNTPLDVCLASIADRRLRRGDSRKLDPKNTIDRARRCARTLDKLEAAEVKVMRLSRDEALAWCRALNTSISPPTSSRVVASTTLVSKPALLQGTSL